MKRRVVITGMGLVSPLGSTLEEFTENLRQGKNVVDRIARFDASHLSCQIAAEIKDFNPDDHMPKKAALRMDRYAQYGVAAAKMAYQDAGLAEVDIDRERMAVIMGSGNGGIETTASECRTLVERGPARLSPFFIPMMISNMVAGQISILLEILGPSYTVVTACASGNNAIGDAFRMIQHGDADVVVAGGAEAPITELSLGGFCRMKAVSTRKDAPKRASRPFDKQRDGFVMGEGAGVLILEEYEQAKARGAKIYAEVVGYGRSSDAYHITTPAPEGKGAYRCMRAALKDAGLAETDIDYINAHGTSTPYNDLFETQAIKGLFGQHAYELSINSTKSMMGHLLGAAGAVESIACIVQLQHGFVHPTINLEESEEELDLDYTPVLKERSLHYAMNNSLGFGGHNTTLIFKKL